ncbi:MAG: ribonuclease P protein component [Oscillospiraceae bacterium]|jgi:ribonuclease P protein component|nr:ribonuclease P protein component [Oscillospiraceae bacterium]
MRFSVSLKRNHEFRRLYSKGKSAASGSMVLYCRRSGSERNRVGFTVSTKLGGAVTRNRIRRRLRETYRLSEDELRRGYDIVVVARSAALDTPFEALRAEFRGICGKLGLLL